MHVYLEHTGVLEGQLHQGELVGETVDDLGRPEAAQAPLDQQRPTTNVTCANVKNAGQNAVHSTPVGWPRPGA